MRRVKLDRIDRRILRDLQENGRITNVELDYSTDGGNNYPGQVCDNATYLATTGTCEWTIPNDIGTNLKVRIRDVSNTNLKDESDVPFTIKGQIALTYPDGTERWQVGTTQATRNPSIPKPTKVMMAG